MLREIVIIDEELCDGCGLCVPNCEEGALAIVDGKVKLISDHLCDGLGACLGHCPQGAIRIETKEAEAFDEAAVEKHLEEQKKKIPASPEQPALSVLSSPGNGSGGCPGSAFASLKQASCPSGEKRRPGGEPSGQSLESELRHWPVQLRLLAPNAPVLRDCSLLVCADCVPVAFADFHRTLLRDHAVVIACPKLDNPEGYVEKLAEMIRTNDLEQITVAHMEVPCCTGISYLVEQAIKLSGREAAVRQVVIGIDGAIRQDQEIHVQQ